MSLRSGPPGTPWTRECCQAPVQCWRRRRRNTGSRSDRWGQAAGPLIAEDEPSAVMLAGRPVAAADGMLVNLADTPANRAFFGSTGTAGGSSLFPQLRVVTMTARAGRARLTAILRADGHVIARVREGIFLPPGTGPAAAGCPTGPA
jgi:hypothetical protein